MAIDGYHLVRSDNPSNTKRGGVCIYYRNCLPLKVINVNYLNECIIFEISLGNKLCSFITLYRSPSQSSSEFDMFLKNLELNLESSLRKNPSLSVLLDDFNAKSNNWHKFDKTNPEGIALENITSQYSLHQVINELTHILQSSSSCTDLLFTSHPNLIIDSGVHPSLHPNCHHQIIYAKFNLNVHYPPPYVREVWHYTDANIDLIRRSIEMFDWDNALKNKSVDDMVAIFNKTILNILSNFIPHESVTFDDKDPPWFNDKIKSLSQEKNLVFKELRKNSSNIQLQRRLENLQNKLHFTIHYFKQKYYQRMADKINKIKKSSKAYWSLLKIFLNIEKVPLIPPILFNDEFVTDFKRKAELFNCFFGSQCSLIVNSSKLPNFEYLTDKRLSTINFSDDEIFEIIKKLDVNKAHGHDNISIRMIKICGKSICNPLRRIFEECLCTGSYPQEWKKGNIVPIYKKGDKQLLKNYRPVSLLPILGKILERLIFEEMYPFFITNNLIASNQSGFKTGDSCINQLIAITHDIYSSLDKGYEVRGVFLDISKAFDKVWHEGIIFKLKQNGISGNLLHLMSDFLSNRKQRVILNGQFSSWTDVNAGVPQGSILGPLLFLIYINDLTNHLSSNAKLFADDTSLFSVTRNVMDSANELNNDLRQINKWATQWKMSFNPDPTKQAQEVIFSRKSKKTKHPPLFFNETLVSQTSSQKHLGIILDQKLTFEEHLQKIYTKIAKTLNLLRKLQNLLPRSALITIYKSFVRPHLDYGDIIYEESYNSSFHQKLESVQYKAGLAITGAIKGTSKEKLYNELGLESLQNRRWYRKLCHFYKYFILKQPKYLLDIIPVKTSNYNTRNTDKIPPFKTRHNFFKNSFFPSAIIEWNKLNSDIRNISSFSVFRKTILCFIRPNSNSVFNSHNPKGIKLLSRLRLGLSHLREHKFKHSFEDTTSPLCSCNLDNETTTHYFLHCPLFSNERRTLLNTIRLIDNNLLENADSNLVDLLLYGDATKDVRTNTDILNAAITYILSSNRFEGPLM